MTGISLQLFGPPALLLPNGKRVQGLDASKTLGLLAFLVLESGTHSRESLATLLYGESADEEARAALRQMLKRLRDLIGDSLLIDRQAVELSREVRCDAVEFLEALRAGADAATRFEVPGFMAGFSVRHAPGLEEWVARTRTDLLARYQQALAGLARQALARWRWREAVELSDRWILSDPLSDEAARLGIEALYLSGDRESAIERFRAHRKRLADEAAPPPGPAILELVHRIESDRTKQGAGTTSDEWLVKGSFEANLTGRDRQWDGLMKAWRSLASSHGKVVLIEGEAGAGKSRLADEFLRWVTKEGATVLRAHGYDPQAGVPYGPIVEALREAIDAPGLAGTPPEWLAEVTRLLPELRQRFPALPDPSAESGTAERWRLFEGVAQTLLSLATERRVVMFVDDLQWCDGESCALLHFLVRRFADAPVLLIAAVTLGEVEREAPAARLCRALRSHATVLPLPPLDEKEVWQMIREMGRISAPDAARRLAARVHDVTQGNPFYVMELLRGLFTQGVLTVDTETGAWLAPQDGSEAANLELPLSATVRDTIAERVERLPYELRDLLATVAVAGSSCRTELLSQVHGISRLHAAALCDALVDRHLLVEEAAAYRCAHPMMAAVVRDGLTASRRREIHRELARALDHVTLEALRPEVAGDIARHADRGGERDLAYRYALVASEVAGQRLAHEEALSWLDLAAGLAGPGPESDDVNHRTAALLERAGWNVAPRVGRVPGRVSRGLGRGDLDLTSGERAS